MPDEVFAWMRRVKAVEREYAMTRLALDRLRQQAMANPGVLTANQRYRDISTAADRLEGTYVIRIFAEFLSATSPNRLLPPGPSDRDPADFLAHYEETARLLA